MGASFPAPRFLFATGSHRGGTSLLYALLNQHPRVRLMYEAQALGQRRLPASGRAWRRRLEFWNRALSRHGLDNALDASSDGAGPDDAGALYRLHGAGRSLAYVGEKEPGYQTRLPRLFRQFPEARVVVIWRDAAHVVRSVRHAGRNCRFFSRPGWTGRTVFARERLLRDARRLDPEGKRVHFLSYEQLLADVEGSLRALCAFLELPYDPRMASLEQADLSAVDVAPHHCHLRAGHIGRHLFHATPLKPGVEETLRRFEARWEALRDGVPAPALSPRMLWYRETGRLAHAGDRLRHLVFRHAPLFLLQAYRRWKHRHPDRQASLDPKAVETERPALTLD